MHRIAVVAHRGASDVAPENTLPALTKARELGVDAVAFDVQGTDEGEPIVFADARLDRTTGAKGRVARTKLEEIRGLDAGSWFKAEFAGTPIPTLEEALKAIPDLPSLHIHLPEVKAGSEFEGRLAAVLSARKPKEGDCLLLPDSASLACVRTKLPGWALSLLLEPRADKWLYLDKARKLGLNLIRPHREQIDAKLVSEAHAAGVQVFAFFGDEEKEIREVLARGVDGIYTHRVGRLKATMEAWVKETEAKA